MLKDQMSGQVTFIRGTNLIWEHSQFSTGSDSSVGHRTLFNVFTAEKSVVTSLEDRQNTAALPHVPQMTNCSISTEVLLFTRTFRLIISQLPLAT